MDHANLDNLFDVPDTPNRLVAKDLNGRSCINVESDLSTSGHLRCGNVAGESNENRVSANGIGRKRLFMRPPRSITGTVRLESPVKSSTCATGDSLSSRNGVPFTKVSSIPSFKEKHSFHHAKSEDTESKSKISCRQDYPVMKPTKQSGSTTDFVKAPTAGAQDSDQVEKLRMPSAAINKHSHFDRMTSSIPSSSASIEKELDDLFKIGSSLKSPRVKDSAIDLQPRARRDVSASHINSSRVLGQKRLVRNGCISPHNIVKAKKPAEEDTEFLTNGLSDTSLVASSAGTSSNSHKELISKNGISSTVKGKGVVIDSPPSKECEAAIRSLISVDEKAKEISDSSRDACRSSNRSAGWISTRNRSNLNLSSVRRTSEMDHACFITHSSGSTLMGRDDASLVHNSSSDSQHLASTRHVSDEFTEEKGSPSRRQCHRANGHSDTVRKRLKHGPASSSHGECSTSATDDLDIILLDSPENMINRRSTKKPNHTSTTRPVIEVDTPSPATRPEGSHVVGSSSRNEDARASQLEADERLARELQEQLYNEMPSFGIGEIDEDVALALMQEDFLHASPGGDNQLPNLNGSLAENIRRRQPRNASNAPRRVSQAQASTSNRMARLRSRFPGQPRRLTLSRGRNSLFPANMDVDMRMSILESLEAFSNMDIDGSFFQTQRDFNENDYEMLLALDDNNRQVGASSRQINNLPQSTIQIENNEEVCAVCLETPAIGDVIRHLPCLHKFHKDCIDPWLRRKTSCPVCKSSIT